MATNLHVKIRLVGLCYSTLRQPYATKFSTLPLLIGKGRLSNYLWRQFSSLKSTMAEVNVNAAKVGEEVAPTSTIPQIETKVEVPSEEKLNADEAKPAENKQKFLRRRKMVLMLSYCGQGYFGMQKNPGTKTIEEELLLSLLKSGHIDEESYKLPRVMQFQRAARTDKNVSAARQIVSMKMPDVVEIEKINEFLPPGVRVMGAKKVTKGFDSKGSCDARTYMYMIPTFAFTPLDQNVVEDYRIVPEVLESLREILKVYLGTKNFHNFTSRRKSTDPSSKRYIISFTASDPFIKDEKEYLILRVKGQSFMLHQIRKMIGLAVAYMRGFAGKDTFTKSWASSRIDIPKAPGVGLVLDHVHYDRYNERYGSDGMHASLTWEEVQEKVEVFCQTHIYPVITKTENEEKSMFEWLATLPYHTYDIREQRQLVPAENDDELNFNPCPLKLSKIGEAANKVDAIPVENEEEQDSDADNSGKGDAIDGGVVDEDDLIVKQHLAKKRRMV